MLERTRLEAVTHETTRLLVVGNVDPLVKRVHLVVLPPRLRVAKLSERIGNDEAASAQETKQCPVIVRGSDSGSRNGCAIKTLARELFLEFCELGGLVLVQMADVTAERARGRCGRRRRACCWSRHLLRGGSQVVRMCSAWPSVYRQCVSMPPRPPAPAPIRSDHLLSFGYHHHVVHSLAPSLPVRRRILDALHRTQQPLPERVCAPVWLHTLLLNALAPNRRSARTLSSLC